ncbi:hypothetical protein N0V93_004658 [Gnomoniopsis smithogilvyi]|uniref:Uncharacterized protein n=1 Tax=Gnomoniopsis smithogilvyi TaxID=1191159 RepID=A0A9W8YRV9_9PEZI|nr:hypothetical protein N0V93_004658 [Gnomoniopsis smithogilvyi]
MPARSCSQCQSESKTVYSCIQCNNLAFCNDCWSKWVLHQDGAVGYDGRPHEQSDPTVVRVLRQILEPVRSDADIDLEHQVDEDTTWFGVSRDSSNQPMLHDYGRFATLVSESQTQEPGNRYPQLVSFIGQTGAGKSTIIKMLIERLNNSALENGVKFPSPVTSSTNDMVPTTGDVHLYADPLSYYTKLPILFADCEGLDGGEATPRGLRAKVKQGDFNSIPDIAASISGMSLARPPRLSNRTSANTVPKSSKKLRKRRHGTQRDIAWAVTPETKKREYAVTQLYPRLLYTFSDVVVFVLRNPRAFESTVLEKLLDWGARSINKSLNQPALPHAIIILNATENVDAKEWDTETATENLLEGIRSAIFREPRFDEQARFWRDTGRKIQTTRDLLECYYASITIVRIPFRGRYMLIDEQVGKLSAVIRNKCEASLLAKKRARMLATAEKLQVYLEAAYDHFSEDLTTPFDFIREALKHNPIPQDLGGNILNLAISIQQNDYSTTEGSTVKIFYKMVPMIASCIMLDCVRQSLLGTTVQLLNDAYVEFCKFALERFVNLYAPCAFVSSKFGPCCNMKSGHNPKGHQNKDGRIIGIGTYEASFDLQEFSERWIELIRKELQHQQSAFTDLNYQTRKLPEHDIAAELHLRVLNEFYRGTADSSRYISYSACFSCLRELPEHALPCGHILCLPCVKAYGRPGPSKTSIVLSNCPLHQHEMIWDPPWNVFVKPRYAGVRTLCLDGGGVRGIVELQVLKAIQTQLEDKLPIQKFFDLIVGTSTGGIIALGLGVKNWTVDQCIKKFEDLCTQAFQPRELNGIPLLEKIAIFSHGSKYKTKPFEKVLKETFEEWPLFGGQSELGEMFTKVAVTSTTAIQQHPVVLANYNRPNSLDNDLSYEFLRSNGPSKEFKIWEAARATSAAPPFFKKFVKQSTADSYLDGALYNNCPVWVAHHERQLIWGDVATALPDILLSIGTGTDDKEVRSDLRGGPSSTIMETEDPQDSSNFKPRAPTSRFFAKEMWTILFDRLGSLMKCKEIWNNYITETTTSRQGRLGGHRRLIRIDPELRMDVPELDAVDALAQLKRNTATYLRNNPARIREIAHRLIASTFFFEKDNGSIKHRGSGYECSGTIHCRFANGSDDMKGLGGFLRNCHRNDFNPYFAVAEEETQLMREVKLPLGESLISDMCLRGTFKFQQFKIFVSKELAATTISLCLTEEPYPISTNSLLPISGFPRELISEDKTTQGEYFT